MTKLNDNLESFEQGERFAWERLQKTSNARPALSKLTSSEEFIDACNDPCIKYFSVSRGWGEAAISITLRIENETPRDDARRFVLNLAKILGQRGKKWVLGSDDALGVTFQLGEIEVVVQGYVPPTCTITEEMVTVPAITKIVRKIVCNDEEEAS
jgi:hypothetical protein